MALGSAFVPKPRWPKGVALIGPEPTVGADLAGSLVRRLAQTLLLGSMLMCALEPEALHSQCVDTGKVRRQDVMSAMTHGFPDLLIYLGDMTFDGPSDTITLWLAQSTQVTDVTDRAYSTPRCIFLLRDGKPDSTFTAYRAHWNSVVDASPSLHLTSEDAGDLGTMIASYVMGGIWQTRSPRLHYAMRTDEPTTLVRPTVTQRDGHWIVTVSHGLRVTATFDAHARLLSITVR